MSSLSSPKPLLCVFPAMLPGVGVFSFCWYDPYGKLFAGACRVLGVGEAYCLRKGRQDGKDPFGGLGQGLFHFLETHHGWSSNSLQIETAHPSMKCEFIVYAHLEAVM